MSQWGMLLRVQLIYFITLLRQASELQIDQLPVVTKNDSGRAIFEIVQVEHE